MAATARGLQRPRNSGGGGGGNGGRAGDGESGNPAYQQTGPSEVVINGVRCVNTDAATICGIAEWYRLMKVK